MWSLFLIGYLYVSGIWLLVKNRHQKDMWNNVVGLCAKKVDIILSSIDNIVWMAYVIT
jgi:hypothetical protein